MWISKVSYAKEVIKLSLDLNIDDDQMALIKIMRNRPDLIVQITNKTIFKQLSNRLIQYRSSFLGSDC